MKNFNFLMAWIGLAVMSSSFLPSPEKATLTINAQHLENNKGQVVANLFKKGDNVRQKSTIQCVGKIVDGKSVLVFPDIPYGEYAILMWHDQNANGDLDHAWGMPNEPIGYSNGWKLTLFSGMPNFEKLKFEFSEKQSELTIQLQ